MDLGGKLYIGGWAAGWAGCQGAGLGWLPGGWAGLAGLSWAKLLKSGRGVQKAVIVGYSLGGGCKKLS